MYGGKVVREFIELIRGDAWFIGGFYGGMGRVGRFWFVTGGGIVGLKSGLRFRNELLGI